LNTIIVLLSSSSLASLDAFLLALREHAKISMKKRSKLRYANGTPVYGYNVYSLKKL